MSLSPGSHEEKFEKKFYFFYNGKFVYIAGIAPLCHNSSLWHCFNAKATATV